MGRKTISLSDEAYDQLDAAKEDGNSFNDVVLRLTDDCDSEPNDEQTMNRVAVTNVDEIARAAADEVENRMARR